MTESRRIKAGYLPKRLAIGMFFGDRLTSLPKDAQILGFFHEWTRDALGIYIHSETFEEVPEGHVLPIIELMFERVPQ